MAQRFYFCDFSQIVGFPNALPDRDQWEDFLPEFHATSWEEPYEHLLDLHEAIHQPRGEPRRGKGTRGTTEHIFHSRASQ
jgi:hypothetical protein